MKEFMEHERSPEPDNAEIPLAYRLAHLGIDTAAYYPMLTAQQIADELGIEANLVRRPLKKYGVETETRYHDQLQTYLDHYPQYALQLIREERAWREWYLSLPERVNAKQIASAVGRSDGWTMKTLEERYPNAPRQRDGRRLRMYPRSSIQALRDITFATPPDENWPTVGRLAEVSGKDWEWVQNELSRTTLRPELRRQSISGREFMHYPPDAFDVIREAIEQRPDPAGDWLTVNSLCRYLGRSFNWVTGRLETNYADTAEMRLDDMGAKRIHYPPSVLEALKAESAKLESYEPSGDWVTMSTLKKRLGTHALTLTKMLEEIGNEAEVRRDALGRPKVHYSPTTQQQLAAKVLELHNIPAANDWLSFKAAQKIIGRPAPWIRQQFEERGVTSETRLDLFRRPVEHYEPNIIQAIKEYGDTLDAGTMVCLKDISMRMQKSQTWVVSRLRKLNIQPEKRFTANNQFTDHYPESIIEQILSL